jgi:hypothetical protein
MLAVLRWETPPAPSRNQLGPRQPSIEDDPDQPIAVLLRGHPGRWAVVGDQFQRGSSTHAARRINRAHSPAWAPPGSFEAVARFRAGTYTVWARYIGRPT